jgi:hypothetical protein
MPDNTIMLSTEAEGREGRKQGQTLTSPSRSIQSSEQGGSKLASPLFFPQAYPVLFLMDSFHYITI